jgi:chromosome segregation ATPase
MMRMISAATMLGLLLAGATALRASQADEPGDKARATPEGPATRAERGRAEVPGRREARRREARARRDAPGGDVEQAAGRLKERLQDLRDRQKKLVDANAPEREQARLRDQIARTERQLNALSDRLAGGRPATAELQEQARNIEEAGRRIRHLRVAAENLKAAGVEDLAAKLGEQADTMEREVGEAKARLARERNGRDGGDPRDAQIRELRQQNEKLQAEIRELRQKLEAR